MYRACDIRVHGWIVVSINVQHSVIEEIKASQKDDNELEKLKFNVVQDDDEFNVQQ